MRYHARHPITSSLAAPTPDNVDLRQWFAEPRNQGSEGACSGFATAALAEYLANSTAQKVGGYLSPAYLYARTRMLEHTFPNDVGATVGDEMAVLHQWGVCPEEALPYTMSALEAATPAADAAAMAFKLSAPPVGVPLWTASCVEQMLASSKPVVMGMTVYQSFEDTGFDGRVPLPNTQREQRLGGHAMLCVGYDRPGSRFILRNSWGTGAGDKGYFYLPYAMLQYWTEAWTYA